MDTPRIETTRLRLRPLTLDDVDDLHRLWTEPGVRQYLWDEQVIPRERVESTVESSLASFAAHGFGLWAVLPEAEQSVIGFCGFWYFHEPPKLELLYGIDPAYWNRGLATEAARAMINYGFEELSFKRIEASTDAANLASARVMEKAGMSFWKREPTNGLDAIYYAISREAFTLTRKSKMSKIKFSWAQPLCDRRHFVFEEDVKIVLSRLPEEVYQRLRVVHFNDRSWGARTLGYTTKRGGREVSICALPPRVSLTRFLVPGQSPGTFGAKAGRQWPKLAVRRFLLYDVLLHELGHLQIIDPESKDVRRKFAGETKAQEFADRWRKELWKEHFDHPDPVHNPPTEAEFV